MIFKIIYAYSLAAVMMCGLLHAQESRPNVIVLFIDDLGWNDIGANGSAFYETPHIDALAKGGVNFKRSYSANPVCSPTRAALMTGKAPQRVGITQWISSPKVALDLSEVTIGEAFQEAGYRTGYVGKWHLGKANDVQPEHQGFEYTKAVNRAGQPASFFYPFGKGNRPTNVPDLKDYKKGDYLTDALTDKAIEFIEQGSDKPFFLCLSHYAVHTPIQAPEPLVEKYTAKKIEMYGEGKPEQVEEKYNTLASTRQENPTYAAMMENLDTNVGRIIELLEEKGELENTIILFTSDNGGLAHRRREPAPTSIAPLRSGKAWTYEGGIRIPTIISWPGKIQPAISDSRVITMDMYPTLLDLAGIALKPEQHLDGESLKPVLNGEYDRHDRVLAWTYPHVHGSGHKPSDAILVGNYKLIRFPSDEPTELYNLATDIGERNNIAKQHPEKVQELVKLLDDWLEKTQ
ncbi:MAG: sulfatase [Luteolibacter sp.]